MLPAPGPAGHPHLLSMLERARRQAAAAPPRIGVVFPCDALALESAAASAAGGLARAVLVGPRERIEALAERHSIDLSGSEIEDCADAPAAAAAWAARLAREGALDILMKGALHTDEFMAAMVRRDAGLRTKRRISHAFVFDLPRYHKPLALADCVVNIAPDVDVKGQILGNAIELLRALGMARPKVGIVAAVETVHAAIPATVDADALVARHRRGAWREATVEGPFGFDNVISAEAARLKKLHSEVAGDADLLLLPDLNAANLLYKSFTWIGGGECAGLVLGAKLPIVLTSRADSVLARTASVALAVLAARARSED